MKERELYASPGVEVMEIKMEGVIAASIPDVTYGQDLF